MFGERQTSAAQTHKYLGQDEEERLPQACDKMQACRVCVRERCVCLVEHLDLNLSMEKAINLHLK